MLYINYQVTHIGCGHGFTFVSGKKQSRLWMSTKIGALGQLKKCETRSTDIQGNLINTCLCINLFFEQFFQLYLLTC